MEKDQYSPEWPEWQKKTGTKPEVGGKLWAWRRAVLTMNIMGAVKGPVRVWYMAPTVNRNLLAPCPVLSYNIPMPVSNPSVGGGSSDLLSQLDKDVSPTATSGDNASTGVTIGSTPANDSYVKVKVNGNEQVVGDGVKTKDCYFSDDAGATAKTISDISSGDEVFWNGLVARFDLETSDVISLGYVVSV